MADSTHTLELEIRTKDFASDSLKRVGDAGKEAGSSVSEGLKGANDQVKSFGDRWLKLDDGFKTVAKAGVGALNAVNLGIQTANASSENMGQTMLSTASGIAMGFAAGGPVGGALAATAAAVGLIVNAFDDAEEAAKNAAREIKFGAKEIDPLLKSGDDSIKKILQMREAQKRNMDITTRMLNKGESREMAAYEVDLAKAAAQATAAYGDRIDAEKKAWDLYYKLKGEVGPYTAEAEAARLMAERAGEATGEAQKTMKALDELRAARSGELQILELLAARESDIAKTRKDKEANEARARAIAEENKQLQDQAKEMLRIAKLSEDQLAVDKFATMEARLRQSGAKELADEMRALIDQRLKDLQVARDLTAEEKKRKEELLAYKAMVEEAGKDLGFFADKAKEAKEHIKSAASTNLAAPIKEAGQEMKKLLDQQVKGRGGARFDEEGNFLGLGLAEARQERRDALRSMKRRRAERGRMGTSLAGSVNIRSGRRAGGLGGFSAWQGGGGDMGVSENAPSALDSGITVSLDEAPVSDVNLTRRATKKKLPILDVPMPADFGLSKALTGLASGTEAMSGAAKEGAQAAETAKTNTDTAATETGRMASALEGMSSGIQELSGAMASAATAVGNMATVVNKVVADVQRLKEAANLRGGN